MKTIVIGLYGEIRKCLLIDWTYRANTLVTMFTIGFIFMGISFMISDGSMDPEEVGVFFIGYLAWFYALMEINEMAYGVRGEMVMGTLEQMAMGPLPIALVMVGRVIANLIVTTIQLIILGLVLSRLLNMTIPVTWEGILIMALTLVGVSGFGYLIAGGIIVFKQFDSFANLFTNLLLFLNGSMMPVERMPSWMAGVSYTLPSTQGIIVLRKVVLGGQSLFAVWQDGSLVGLTIHSSVYLLLGLVAFILCERIAKARGSLGMY